MGFDFKPDLVFEQLDSSMFEREMAIPNQAGKLYRMLMLFLFWKSELLPRAALTHFYPTNNHVTRLPLVKSPFAHIPNIRLTRLCLFSGL